MRALAPIAAALLCAAGACHAAGDATYARPELLVGPAELAASLAENEGDAENGGGIVVLHVVSSDRPKEGGVPGAVTVNAGEWKAAFGEGTDAEAWGRRIGAVGIGPDSRVVVYDEGGVTNAARVWWILRYWGVEQAALLNGGLAAWQSHAESHSADLPTKPPGPRTFTATPHPDRLRTTDQMIEHAAAGVGRVLDTRSADEVGSTGLVSPHTEHCDWVELVDRPSGKLKPAGELVRILKIDPAGADLGEPVVTYCRSGGRASVAAFALELMGAERVANYYGSWSAWEQRDAPGPLKSGGE